MYSLLFFLDMNICILTEASQFPGMSFVFARDELTLETNPWLLLASADAFGGTRAMERCRWLISGSSNDKIKVIRHREAKECLYQGT